MEYMTSHEIRKKFLDYFAAQQHQIVGSSSLVPGNDPTLLFTNAGMVQFKEVFLGLEQRPYKRAVSVQRCLRAGGKHNDLENVGYTRRHHTFFEMLGNFSFGDYFKSEAIFFGWAFLTQILGIPPAKLWVTVFRDDAESETIWLEKIGVDPERISRCDEKDNFWQMGDTGPCGPCTEIFYDHGPAIPGGPPGSPEADGDRYVEIWKIVFMQYARHKDGALTPLPRPCVDTGMGLERVAAVLQTVHDNYDTDIFQFLLKALSSLPGMSTHEESSCEKARRVIVDHIRSATFLIIDGILPSNEGRGYVLRRIIRRALRHGAQLGFQEPFFYNMVRPLVHVMGEAYPELKKAEELAKSVLLQEEEQFAHTLTRGLKKLDHAIHSNASSILSGDIVFQLYDTYGFPPDLTADIARERGMQIDEAGFEIAMQHQRALSQKAQHFTVDYTKNMTTGESTRYTPTRFVGYDTQTTTAQVLKLYTPDFVGVARLHGTEVGIVVLDQTPFYAEGGGQVGDCGVLTFAGGSFIVQDTQKQGDVYLHSGYVEHGTFCDHVAVEATVDSAHRQAVRCHHSATHLLHEALRRVLGPHISQKGSWVGAENLRFDFSHYKPIDVEQLNHIERLVNMQVRLNQCAETTLMSPAAAQAAGAMALFNERYGDQVRVLRLGDFSLEICGGTHVRCTGDIGLFKIISESACAAGVRRIEAVAGAAAVARVEQTEAAWRQLGQLLKAAGPEINQKVKHVLEKNVALEQELTVLRQHYANAQCAHFIQSAIKIGSTYCLAASLQHVTPDILRNTVDQLKQHWPEYAIILGAVYAEKMALLAVVSDTCLPYFNAVELLQFVAHQVGGKGGGRPQMAQGSGTDVAGLADALARVPDWVRGKINN